MRLGADGTSRIRIRCLPVAAFASRLKDAVELDAVRDDLTVVCPKALAPVRGSYGFHPARAVLALVLLSVGPITHVLPHERRAALAAESST